MTGKGIIFEHEVAEKLKAQGFIHVKVTKASRDYGADILAFKDGLEYVIQCKKYKGTVGYRGVKDVSTAIDIYQADRGILVCDTVFSNPAYEAVKKIDKPIELLTLKEIKEWKTKKIKPAKYRPLYYQRNILSKLEKHRRQGNNSALLIMATGLGKTLVAAWDLQSQLKKGEKALFLVHRKDILVDNAEKFHSIINHEKEEFKFGIYFEGKKFQKEDVIFCTFQTIIKHYRKIPRNYFQYIIIDEAHHSPAPTYAKIFSYFNPKFILGITATPKRVTKYDNEFINQVFGRPLVDLDLAESLIRGYLSPVRYSVFCDNIDYKKLRSVNHKLSLEQLNQKYFIPTKDEDIERIIQNETRKIRNAKTIIFCPTIKYINSVKTIGLFRDAEIYHSNMSDFDRTVIFRRFKLGKIRTILVVDLFNEGIDIPDANIVVFLRTTYSPTVFFQQLGRGLRKVPGKKYLRVLDFVGALSKIKKIINAFGHLLIIQDFVEKVEKQKKLSNIYQGKVYKTSGLLEPLELNFFQAGKKVKHKEVLFRKKDFISEIKFLKKHLKKSEGWTEEEIIDELQPICEKLGHFPTIDYLIKIGRIDLSVQIGRQGGVYYFAKKVGYKVKQRPPRYWTRWDNLKKELLPICRKLGKMPTQKELSTLGRSDLITPIRKFGRFSEVAEKLGYESERRTKGYWSRWDNLKKELLPICKKLGGFPTASKLKKLHKFSLAHAINNFGKFEKVARRLGYTLKQKTPGYWSRWENIKNELLPICKKLNRMPNSSYLRRIRKEDLLAAIMAKWGGIFKVAKKLGYKTKRKPKGYYRNWRNFKREMLPICKKMRRMPTQKELYNLHRTDLIHHIRNFGTSPEVAKKLGYAVKVKLKQAGYWSRWENVKKELLPICRKLGKMPSDSYLRKLGKSSLSRAIYTYWGGIRKVKKRLEYIF